MPIEAEYRIEVDDVRKRKGVRVLKDNGFSLE